MPIMTSHRTITNTDTSTDTGSTFDDRGAHGCSTSASRRAAAIAATIVTFDTRPGADRTTIASRRYRSVA